MNKERIVLSICIGTYNRKELLKQLLEEILKYPNEDIELVICDNASTDGTWAMLKEISDKRLKSYCNEKNYGADYNWLNSLWHGDGTYLMNLNDRELIDIQALKKFVEVIHKVEADMIVASGHKKTVEFNADNYINRTCIMQKLGEPGDIIYSRKCIELLKNKYVNGLDIERLSEIQGTLYDIMFSTDNWYWYIGSRVVKDRPMAEFARIKPNRISNGYVFTGSPEGQRAICRDQLIKVKYIDENNKENYAKGVILAYARTFFWTPWRSRHNKDICLRYAYNPPVCTFWIKEIILWKKSVKKALKEGEYYSINVCNFARKSIWKEYFNFIYQRLCETNAIKILVKIKHYIFGDRHMVA